MKSSQQELIVGLDIGSTKVCVVVGRQGEDGIEIIGVGQSQSHGLKNGMIVNIESTAAAIRRAVNEAELMAGCEVNNVVVGIADKFIYGQNSLGVVRVKHGEVTEQDIHRVIESAQAVPLPPNREILHIIPREFIIDEQNEISHPLGMTCSRLEVKLHLVTAASTSIKNITKACHLAGLEASSIVLQSIASAEAVLMTDERELGVALIDIGGGTTDIAVISNNALWHTAEISMAGNHLTGDLAVGMRILINEAESIKRAHGCCQKSMVDKDEQVGITTTGHNSGRQLSRQTMAMILQARAEELFSLIDRELHRSGHSGELVAGAVITGGTSLLSGMEELAERTLNMPVRIGRSTNVRGLADMVSQPIYSTGVGLVLYGAKNAHVPKKPKPRINTGELMRIIAEVQRVLKEFF